MNTFDFSISSLSAVNRHEPNDIAYVQFCLKEIRTRVVGADYLLKQYEDGVVPFSAQSHSEIIAALATLKYFEGILNDLHKSNSADTALEKLYKDALIELNKMFDNGKSSVLREIFDF